MLKQLVDGLNITIQQIMDDVPSANVAESRQKGKILIVSRVEDKFPGYLHHLFQLALKIKGPNASFAEIVAQMNDISAVKGETKDTIELSRK